MGPAGCLVVGSGTTHDADLASMGVFEQGWEFSRRLLGPDGGRHFPPFEEKGG